MARVLLVADGGAARILSVSDAGPWVFTPIAELIRPTAKLPKRALGSDVPGRVYPRATRGRAPGPPSARRSSVGSDADPHSVEVARFAKRVAARLERLRQRGEISELLMIVEPRFLGVLRAHLAAPLKRKLRHESARDLVKADDARLGLALTRARIPRTLPTNARIGRVSR
ncbi:MAG: host attachment protein [Steroidobacteraceae bacterium]